MSEPTNKNPQIEKFLIDTFGRDRRVYIRNNRCVECGGPADEFHDRLSAKEFTISGLCQTCQDKIWKPNA